jgi:hypothetical protein
MESILAHAEGRAACHRIFSFNASGVTFGLPTQLRPGRGYARRLDGFVRDLIPHPAKASTLDPSRHQQEVAWP